MSLNLTRSSLRIESVVGSGGAQAICKATVAVPDGKPDIVRLLPAKAEAVVDPAAVRVTEGKIELGGAVRLEVPYVASGPDGREMVHYIICTEPRFNAEASLGAAVPGLEAIVEADVDSFEIELAGPRSLALTAIVKADARLVGRGSLEMVTETGDSGGTFDVSHRSVFVEVPVGAAASQFTIRDAFQVPEGNPDIRDLIDYTATVGLNADGLRGGPNRISAAGVLDLRIGYVAESDDQEAVYLAGPQVDFSTLVDLPGANEAVSATGKAYLESITVTKVGSRTLQVEAVARVDARATTVRELAAITDITAKGDELVDVRRQRVPLETLVGKATAAATVSDTFSVGTGKPGIEQVLITSAKARISDARIAPDKVVLSGEVDVYVSYVGQPDLDGEQGRIDAASALGLPFEVSLDMPGVEAGMSISATCEATEVSAVRAGGRAFDVDVKLAASTKVSEELSLDLVTDAATVLAPVAGQAPSRRVTVYIVQPGDTMWGIARRYGKLTAKLAEANGLTGQEPAPGQKVLVTA